jgi:hypothetical protein
LTCNHEDDQGRSIQNPQQYYPIPENKTDQLLS